MRVHILINKYAGSGKAPGIMEDIKSILTDYEVTFSYTEKTPDSFIDFIAINSDIKYLIVIGGDGTMNYAAQALAGSDIIMIPVNAGTGGDLSRTIGKVRPPDIPEIISRGNFREIDLGKIEINGVTKFFINIMEAGLGGHVMIRVNSVKRRTSMTFLTAIIISLFKAKPVRASITTEGDSMTVDILDLIVANGQYYGKGIHASPESDISDGFLDVHIIKFMPKYRVMLKLSSLRTGGYTSDKDVINKRVKSIHVNCRSILEIDGETLSAEDYEISIYHNALKIFPLI